jgi:hypothetical protein
MAPITESGLLVPDAVGEGARVEILAQTIADLQTQLFRHQLAQTANGADDDDPMPSRPGEDQITYGERARRIREGIERIAEDQADLMERVAERIKAAQAMAGREAES